MARSSTNNRIVRLSRSLFGSWLNATLTLISIWLLFSIIPPFFNWAVTASKWLPVDSEECVQGYGACWAFIQTKFRFIIFGRFPYEEQWRTTLACILVLSGLGISLTWKFWGWAHWKRFLITLWLGILLISAVLMRGGVLGLSVVPIGLWSGLPLTLMLSLFGISFAFLFSIFLALGRGSKLPIVRWVSVGYIELI